MILLAPPPPPPPHGRLVPSSSSPSAAPAPPAGGHLLVYDFDSTLPFPCPLPDYFRHTLGSEAGPFPPGLRRCFRVLPSCRYLDRFASDRSHMRQDGGGGAWLQPPPPYPSIAAAADGAAHTLPAYLTFPPHAEVEAAGEACGMGQSSPGSGWDGLPPEQQRKPFGVVLTEPAFLHLFGGAPGAASPATQP